MIYADYNGSAPLLDEVKKYLLKRFESSLFANPNAIHSLGGKLLSGIEKSRDLIAQVVGCYPDQIIFNSGSSEGVTTIFHSLTQDKNSPKKIIISSPIEHAIVNLNLEEAKSRGFQIIFLETSIDGLISLNHLESLLKEKSHEVAFVTVMAANNETGVIQPYLEIARICGQFKTPYFSDTTQFIGKEEFHFLNCGIDFAVCSGHKLGALTGSGFIIAKDPALVKPLIFSKYHEKGLRGGTQHYLGIETMAVALNDFNKHKASLKTLKNSRLKFEAEIKHDFPQVKIIGDNSERLAGTTLIAYPGIHGQAVQIELESNDIFVTTSAACSDNQPETSDALKALKVDDAIGRSVIRISLGLHQGEEEYSQIARNLKNAYNKLRKIQSY